MSTSGFIKIGYSSGNVVKEVSSDIVAASPHILARLEKLANTSKVLAPKSDDFLYFTIIFLKAAESALVDDDGNLKKVGHERAWGYFDDKYHWHGNVPAHKNNNGDIFPESELKKAARDWIGTPLCVDHKSESVDGIRGIILDTYYDEKHKQVVGLCALDKVNYPNLARKVQTGVVRYGSMGTAVTTSICSDCGNRATTPKEYCVCVTARSAYGEVNIGLKPMEYSLVVQPAEPGARLLRCIASIGEHKAELSNYGVSDFEKFSAQLSLGQAEELDQILKVACGPRGCSVTQRQSIVNNYLHKYNLVKTAEEGGLRWSENREVQFAKALSQLRDAGASDSDISDLYESFGKSYDDSLENNMSVGQGETFSSGQDASGRAAIETVDNEGVRGTGGESTGLVASDNGENIDTFQTGGVGPETYAFSSLDKNKTHKNIMEEIMNDSKLNKRAELRRRIAYYYGGAAGDGKAEPVEPSTFTSEDYKKYWMDDKHMHQDKAMGGQDGMFPGDEQVKEQQKRAQLAQRRLERKAYFYGGAAGDGKAEPVEPSTFTSEDYKKYWMDDKHMHQDKAMGGQDGMFPGDEQVKEQQKRARLSTKFKQVRALNGAINKQASCFEVYADDKLILATTAKDIYGPKLEENWKFLTSKEYGKAVVAAIRTDGLRSVAGKLTRLGQADPMAGLGAPPAAPGALDAPMPEEAPLPEESIMPEEDPEAGAEDIDEEDPQAKASDALVVVEEAFADLKEAIEDLGSGKGGVEVNIDTDADKPVDEITNLSRNLLKDMKIVLAESSESADELALIIEAYDHKNRISPKKYSELKSLTASALEDSAQLTSEARTLLKMAKIVSSAMVKTSEYVEEAEDSAKEREEVATKEPSGKDTSKAASKAESELFAQALNLRKQRRLALLESARKKIAMEALDSDEVENESPDLNEADDGAGHAQRVAESTPKGDSDKAGAPAVPVGTPQEVANKAPTGNLADDGKFNLADDKENEMEDIAEEEAEEEVEEHEEDMHGGKDENDANDVVPNDGVQGASFVVEKLPSPRAAIAKKLIERKAAEEKEAVKLRMRRAYDLAMDMQRKGLIAPTRASLDSQVDLVLEFDDKAFEAFKRSIANARMPETIKVASDLGGLNIGYETPEDAPQRSMVENLSALFNK